MATTKSFKNKYCYTLTETKKTCKKSEKDLKTNTVTL